LIPFISLTFAHMLIVYSNKIQTGEVETTDLSKVNIDDLSREIGRRESQSTDDKINPTPEELEELKRRLSELQNRPLSDIIKEENDGLRRLSYTKNG